MWSLLNKMFSLSVSFMSIFWYGDSHGHREATGSDLKDVQYAWEPGIKDEGGWTVVIIRNDTD